MEDYGPFACCLGSQIGYNHTVTLCHIGLPAMAVLTQFNYKDVGCYVQATVCFLRCYK